MLTILIFAIVLLSLTIHEVSHGTIALLLGDKTAKSHGRLTLNPIKHIDPFGTILMPLILLLAAKLTGGIVPVFGFAKPVPVNHHNFKHPMFGRALVAIAGPLSNIFLAFSAALILIKVKPDSELFILIVKSMVQINLLLAVFNMLPIPPLDGSRIVSWLLPAELSKKYDKFGRFGFILVLLILQTDLLSILYKKAFVIFIDVLKKMI